MGKREHSRTSRGAYAALLLLLLVACSSMFPHAELAIQPEGATLDELGLALIADVERWVDGILFIFGISGL